MSIRIATVRQLLQDFRFQELFIEIGWSNPVSTGPVTVPIKDSQYSSREISQLSGAAVFEISTPNGGIPDKKSILPLHKKISETHHENLLIFVNDSRTQSLWYWVKREDGRKIPRSHYYFKGQPGDLFLTKLSNMVFEVADFDAHGKIPVREVASRLRKALDIETTTKKFYREYDELRLKFVDLIGGIRDEGKRHWYASVLLNRLMFVWFLQKKFFLDNGDDEYLGNKLSGSRKSGKDKYYESFLKPLFFEGFAKREADRSAETNRLLGKIRYLNGGLFLKHPIEEEFPKIRVPDEAFENLFGLFGRYSWNLDDSLEGKDDEISPDVLGFIFEKYINQKEFGAYYTRPEITEYLCDRTISKLILNKVAEKFPAKRYDSLGDLLLDLDAPISRHLLEEVLPALTLLDPACGSGAFLVAAMKTLIDIYSAILGRIEFIRDLYLDDWLKRIRREHPSTSYYIKKRIISDNLFGVDIMEEGAEIAKLRLFLALVSSARSVDELEPLPNIDFNIMSGNSLIGLLTVTEERFSAIEQGDLLQPLKFQDYRKTLADKNTSIGLFKKHAFLTSDQAGLSQEERVLQLRDHVNAVHAKASPTLNQILLDEFTILKIQYEGAQLDGKPKKRNLKLADIEALEPFHWGYHFDEVLEKSGGFDAIITNPPWEIFKPQAKEFFEKHSDLVTKKKMDIKSFEKEQKKLLKDPDIAKAWLEYQSGFPHVSAYFRAASQFINQISIVNGKKAGTDINLYKLFLEQCFNLLKAGGECGIVIPSGIYTDLGSKQLREMLFGMTNVTGLYCFENRKQIFENVDSRFKFVVLTFEKGGTTRSFPAAFMRHDVAELERFPNEDSIRVDVELIKRLSPDSMSVMEFKTPLDIVIAEKMLKFPLLGEHIDGKWNLKLTAEFHMTNDSHLFKKEPGKGRLPLYEGKMIWQFSHTLTAPQYWITESAGRKAMRSEDQIKPDYKNYRIGFRDVAASTNERSAIATIMPKDCFAGNTLPIVSMNGSENLELRHLPCIVAIFNSFVYDFYMRQMITNHLNFHFVWNSPFPRLMPTDPDFAFVSLASSKLICTTPEFDDLAKEVGLGSHKNGVANESERAKLRAELDGLVAHLYGLTEDEFAYILTTFPLVADEVKKAALEEYRKLKATFEKPAIVQQIGQGESAKLEFKSSARWDLRENKPNKEMEKVIVKTIAAFLNSEGGTLLIGVDDAGSVVGLAHDYQTLGKKQNRDGYENFLTTLLLHAFGKDSSPQIAITFESVDGKDVCRVTVKPSPKPVFVKDDKGEHLFIRAGNSTRLLTTKEAIEYTKGRWG